MGPSLELTKIIFPLHFSRVKTSHNFQIMEEGEGFYSEQQKVPIQLWKETAAHYINPTENRYRPVSDRTFKAYFKLEPESVSDLWYYMELHGELGPFDGSVSLDQVIEVCLLWALQFLHCYPSEEVGASFVGVSVKTWRKYVWAVLIIMQRASSRLVSRFSFYGIAFFLCILY